MTNAVAEHASRPPRTSAAIVRRLVCSLALVPIVPASAMILASCCDQAILPNFDFPRWFNLGIATAAVGLSVLIWRSVVIWTLGRKVLTALVSAIPFVQIVWAQPLWNAGCGSNDVLRASQEGLSVGIWIWLCVWVWWGLERLQPPAERPKDSRSFCMTPTAKRIVASIGAIPAGVGFFFIALIALDDLWDPGDWIELPLAYLLAAAIAAGSWLLIWRRQVLWNPRAKRRTVWLTVLCFLPPIAASGLGAVLMNPWDICFGFLPPIAWGLWMILTIRLWTLHGLETEAADDGPRCLECGYRLTGLRATRCPECGADPTLDELWAATLGPRL